MKIIQFNNEEKYIKDFLSFSKKLYCNNDNMEDSGNIRRLLLGEHVLNKYFALYKFVVYDDNNVVARFAITVYPNDSTAYFGFFECINDKHIARKVFEKAESFVKSINCKIIIGPVDASFWIKYRLKINNFDMRPYTGEPYNKDYYFDLFKDNGYKVCDHYTSNQYKPAQYEYINNEYREKYDEFIKKGYEIRSPKPEEFDDCLNELYGLITSLYSDFPIFKDITKEDFVDVFKSYEKIIDFSMVKFGYKNGKMVGFFVSVPNYHNDVYSVNIWKLPRIIATKKSPKEYVMLYIGVNQKHHGLGRALVYSIIQELNKSKKPSIGALAHDGKVTQKYAEDMISDIYEYVLLEKTIK